MIASRAAYTLLWRLLLPLALLRLLWRGLRQRGYMRHVGERLGRYEGAAPPAVVWVHAVSVGETRAAEPLVRGLLRRYPQHHVLITHMTPTGRATAENLFADVSARVSSCYLPYDLPGAVARFLEHFRPRLGLLMETELWPNLAQACRTQAVPLYLVNARLSERSRAGYAQWAGPLAADTLNALAGIVAQSDADAARLRDLGARTVQVAGNLKFDVVPAPDLVARGRAWRAGWPRGLRVILAASTRDGEEALLLDALQACPPEALNTLLLVIVPRHPQRFAEVAALVARRGLAWARRSARSEWSTDVRVWLGDSMGELAAYYAASDAAIIGGSLLPYGGQNLIEACAAGVPVITGPYTRNFAAVTGEALAAGAALEASDASQALFAARLLVEDPGRRARMGEAGLAYAASRRGATERILGLLPTTLAARGT